MKSVHVAVLQALQLSAEPQLNAIRRTSATRLGA